MSTRNRTGHAMIATMAFVAVSSIVCLTAVRRMDTAVRTETASQSRIPAAGPSAYALAWGLSLLETGQPPQSPTYVCRAEVDTDTFYVLTFQQTSLAPLRYSLTVRPATAGDNDISLAPDSFNSNQHTWGYTWYRWRWRSRWNQWWQEWMRRHCRVYRRPWHGQGGD